jgi:hypothetical protein
MRRIGSFSVVQASMEFLVHCCSDISLVSEFLEVEFVSKKQSAQVEDTFRFVDLEPLYSYCKFRCFDRWFTLQD